MMKSIFLPALLILSLITTCAEVDISVPGFPQIASFYGVTEGLVQATITYNFFGFFLGALLYGPLSESFGRRKIMLIGNGIMMLGAIACVFAPSMSTLLFSRFVQGIGASTSVVLVFAMIVDIYEGNKAMQLIGLTNAVLSTAMAIAPVVGGIINKIVGWHGNYIAVAALSAVSWLLLVLFLPESKKTFDKFSTKKIANDYMQLLSSLNFTSVSLIPSLLFAAYMSYIAASSFLYMETFELSVISFAFQQAIIVGVFAVTSLFADKLIPLLGPQGVVKVGMFLSSIACILMLMMNSILPNTYYLLTIFMCLFGVGFAICYPVIFSASLSIFPNMRGTASSLIMAIRALLVTGFTAMVGYFYDRQVFVVALFITLGVFLAILFSAYWISSENQKKGELSSI